MSRPSCIHLALLLLGSAVSCGGDDFDEDVLAGDALPLSLGGADPCATPDQPPDGYTLVRGSDGDDVIDLSNKPGRHMIVAGAGNDTIFAGPGADIVCAGSGRDVVWGQEGNDYIDGGYGNDELHGNAGDDLIHGRAGSDLIYGAGGKDALFGDLLDDRIWGGPGNDLIVGGHGTDFMHGQEGNDWLRGDTNGDQFVGGAGDDVASFTTATPPGQAGFGPNPPDGIDLDTKLDPGQKCAGKNPEDPDLGDVDYPGCAWGDGRDGLMGIERIIGSSFSDRIVAGPGVEVELGLGDGAPVTLPLVFVNAHTRDPGLVFLGGDGDDSVSIEAQAGRVRVTENDGGALSVGTRCVHPSSDPSIVECDVSSELTYLLAWGGAGNDFIWVGGGFSRDFTATIDGGPGHDELHGGPGQDILFAGVDGNDQLFGHAGDDALISESFDGDRLSAGEGNDQLVSNFPCAGHLYQGGPGQDIAGFARVGDKYRVHAQLGGPAENASPFHGRAFSPGTCGGDTTRWTVLEPGLEILEGGSLGDVLYGNDAPNVIWGRDGDDEIRGFGGRDVLDGHTGNDAIYGGPGGDILRGGRGFDHLYAKDGTRDLLLSCGAQGGKLEAADGKDPQAAGCN